MVYYSIICLLYTSVPEMEEVHNGAIKRSIRDIKIEDLLGREEIQINMQEIACLLENKVILVTGAAGSIGSEICRQLAHFPICKLICFDSAETPMHNLRLELEDKFPHLNFVPVIGEDVYKRQQWYSQCGTKCNIIDDRLEKLNLSYPVSKQDT